MTVINARHEDVPEELYHKLPAYSQSQWKHLRAEPELFHARYVATPRRYQMQSTPEMKLGSALHSVLLEGNEIKIIPPEALTSNGQRRGGKWEAWRAMNPGDEWQLAGDVADLKAMCEYAKKEPFCARLLNAEGPVEHSIFWTDKETGIECRGRLDKLSYMPDGGYIVTDLKSCSCDPTSNKDICKKVMSLGYGQQAACYMEAAEALYGPCLSFVFIFVETKAPFRARAWEFPKDHVLVELGRRHNRLDLDELARRIESDNWTDPTFGNLNYVIPEPWQMKLLDENNGVIQQPYEEFIS